MKMNKNDEGRVMNDDVRNRFTVSFWTISASSANSAVNYSVSVSIKPAVVALLEPDPRNVAKIPVSASD